MIDNSDITIRRGFYQIAVGFAAPLVIVFGYYLLAAPKYYFPMLFAAMVALALIVVCYSFYLLLKNEVLYVITRDVLIDNYNGYGSIPWNDIRYALVRSYKMRSVLVLYVKDPKLYAERRGHLSASKKLRLQGMNGDVVLEILDAELSSKEFLHQVYSRIPAANKAEFLASGIDTSSTMMSTTYPEGP